FGKIGYDTDFHPLRFSVLSTAIKASTYFLIDWSLRGNLRTHLVNRLKVYSVFRPISRTALVAFGDEFNTDFRFVGVDELAKGLSPLRVVDDFGPLALVGINEVLHHSLQLSADAEFVVDDDLAQALDAAFHVFQPHARPREAVSGLDVVHQEAVNVFECR